jgi:hypothetical protein
MCIRSSIRFAFDVRRTRYTVSGTRQLLMRRPGGALMCQPDGIDFTRLRGMQLFHDGVVSLFNMKCRTLLAVFASLMLALAGCSKHSSFTMPPSKNYNLGTIEVSGGKSVRYDLGDGKTCTVTPILLADGSAQLTTLIVEAKGSGSRRLTNVFKCPFDQTMTFYCGEDNLITLTLHKPK